MSSILHLETEEVRALARKLIETAEQFDIGFRTLSDLVRALPWESPSQAGYVDEFKALVEKALAAAATGEALGLRVLREVDEWVTVDARGETRFAELGTSSIFTSDWFDWYRGIHGLGDPYTLPEVFDYLDDTEAGRHLIEEARRAGVCFKILPEGTLIGDPDGEVVTVRFDRTDPGIGGYQKDGEIVISDTWVARRSSSDELARVMGHEMQHALDRRQGVLQSYEGMDRYLDDPAQLESFLEHRTETRIASEVRSYARGDAIGSNGTYQDDGITTPAETANILHDRGYEQIYESQLNQNLDGRYTADCWIDADGRVQITLTPVETLGEMA